MRAGASLHPGSTGHDDNTRAQVVQRLRTGLPGLLAVYAFGSRVQGTARADSDLDLAVLVAGYADPVLLFELSAELAGIVGCDVDLLDLRAASTVFQFQVVSTGERWWARDAQAGRFEIFVLKEKNELDQARAALLDDIRQRGTVYGR